jgi:hypothetical protein
MAPLAAALFLLTRLTTHSDHDVICALVSPVYLTRVEEKTVHFVDRSAHPGTIVFDPTKYQFKLALL